MTPADAIEAAMISGACRALTRRSAALRKRAASYTTELEHQGRIITTAAPEASVALGTARLLEECAADLHAMIHQEAA